MRIIKVTIKELFGVFDHEIPFNRKERITIIHGPNGVGKTTILKLIIDLFSNRYITLFNTPFSNLSIYFDNNAILTIEKNVSKAAKSPQLKFLLNKNSIKEEFIFKPLSDSVEKIPLSMIERMVDFLHRIGPDMWIDRRTDEHLTFEEVLSRYGHILPIKFHEEIKIPSWLKEIYKSINIHFIQTQRLFAIPPSELYTRLDRRPHAESAVEKYSDDMVQQIRENLRQSGVVAASLDSTFPHRLLESKLPKEATEKSIREKYENQTQYRNRLMNAGLIDAEDLVALSAEKLNENERKVLWYYLNDVNKKLVVFDTLLKKVELFKDIINTRFLEYKHFSIDKTKGFVFSSKDGSSIPLSTLSSGEQHELVLSYQLLFKVKEGTLILIDEPELSLHVTWQHKFLDDIKKISNLVNLDFLIATHSPSIIHNRKDLMVPLGGSKK